MSDNVHSFIRGVHSNLQSDTAPDPMSLDAEVSVPQKSSLPPPASSFGCSQCPKSFNRRENLSRHMKTHDVPRTHICQICEKTFTRSDLLKRHEAGHERWDKKEPKSEGRRPLVKRRKTSEGPVEIQRNSENFNWMPTSRSESAHLSPLSSEPSFVTAAASISYSNSFQDSSGMDLPLLDNNERQSLENSHRDWMSEEGPRPFVESQRISIVDNAPHPMPGFTFSHHGTNPFPQQYRESYQEILLESQTPTISHGMMGYPGHVSFSNASYLQPEQNSPAGNEWFSNDFHAAMLETGNEWVGNNGTLFSQNTPVSNQLQQNSSNSKLGSPVATSTIIAGEPRLGYYEPKKDALESFLARSAGIIRGSPPPNLPWDEEKWHFLWNPTSAPVSVLAADPITIPFDHPLFQNHNPRYDISESTYYKIRDFLTSPINELHNRKPLYSMPSLFVVNIFIGLYFKHFSHQAPVLHHPTVDTNQLSPSLLAAMMIIGATYSHVKNGRRFAIVLVDVIGWQLQASINFDISLTRNPMTIFTEALLVQMGLWCGNKRAFHVGEAFRGNFVSHTRRLYESEKWNPSTKNSSIDENFENTESRWKRWINAETIKRIYWVVYTTDRQFSALWNQSSTVAIGDLIDLGCPSDETLWYAPSACDWKLALGSEFAPECLSFAAAVGPFLFPFIPPSINSPLGRFSSPEGHMLQPQDHLLPNLNPYTAFLVLLEIQRQIFDFSQECLLASKFMSSQNLPETYGRAPENQHSIPGHQPETRNLHYTPGASPSQALKSRISSRRQELAYSLDLFSKTYLRPHLNTSFSTSKSRPHTFHYNCIVQHHLSTILLDIPLSDILDAVGNSGPMGIEPALERHKFRTREDHELAVDMAVRAAEAIMEINRDVNGTDIPERGIGSDETPGGVRAGMIDTGAYGAVLLMISHVVLCVFAQVADRRQKEHLMTRLQGYRTPSDSGFLHILGIELAANEDLHTAPGMGYESISNNGGKDQQNIYRPSRALFRNAAETLTKFGTWGMALDVALLLYLRAED
ncbi:hypothetical protein DID88_006471 [Monilinia fructigena]|uniref:C2H2-type domain-containing protein n=1 Tax=Monilinia fructigena TaxID=38457 RepID=A0A395IH07_9HELO|nr:hypothetical protein DID88_006471 [Monilinia fructigena]